MFTEISQKEVRNLIHLNLNLDIELKNIKYNKFEGEDKITIFALPQKDLTERIKHIKNKLTVGMQILEIKKDKIIFLPPLMNFISDIYKSYKLDHKLLVSISYGNKISLSGPNSYCYITNSHGDKVSFGQIINNSYKPLIDLGWYLRQGS